MPDPIPVAASPAETSIPAVPASDADTLDLARWAADAVASLAGGTTEPGGLTEPATLHAITGALAAMTRALPPLCRHLAGWLTDEYSAGRLGPDDHGQSPSAAAAPFWFQMQTAASAAASMSTALAAAQAAAGHLRRPARDGEDR